MLISLIRMVRDYLRRHAVLAEIAHLDERTLRDIGLSRRQLSGELGLRVKRKPVCRKRQT